MLCLTACLQLSKTIVTMHPHRAREVLLRDQDGRCFSCSELIKPSASSWGLFAGTPGLYCEYTGKRRPGDLAVRWHRLSASGQLHCRRCMNSKDTAIIPARVLRAMDLNRYPVCKRALEYLSARHEVPNMAVAKVAPELYQRSPELRLGARCALAR